MAAATTFKQQCPSCEAMVSIKKNLIGKKVECHKCKDKFIAKRPTDEDDEVVDIDIEMQEDDDVVDVDIEEVDEAPAKKNTKVGGKKGTTVSSKAPANGKRPKLEIEEEEVGEVDAKKKSKKKMRRTKTRSRNETAKPSPRPRKRHPSKVPRR